MKYFLASLTLLLLSINCIKCQQIISGFVFNSKDSTAIEGTHILNTSNNELAISGKSGAYTIKAEKLDTLLFSNVNFTRRQFIIVNLAPTVILLEPLTTQLQEVVVKYMPESAAAFRRKIIEMELQETDNIKMEGLLPIKPKAPIPPLFQEEKLFNLGHNENFAPMINIPLYYFPKKFSKKYKSEMKYHRLKAEKPTTIAFEKKFNRQIVKVICNLEGDSLSAFINFMDIDPSFVLNATEYELAVYIKEQLQVFNETKK